MTQAFLYLRLALATAIVLAPGWALARGLGLKSASATVGLGLAVVFGALTVTFALGASLTLTLVLVLAAGAGALALGDRGALRRPTGLGWVAAAGVLLGLLLWPVAGEVGGDGLFHLARVLKLASLDDLSLDAVSEFADGGLHPGYAFPLWHGFLALVAKVAFADPQDVVLHEPSILAPLAVVVLYEAGWAMFRRTWAAGAAAAAQVTLVAFAPGHGGAYTALALPATASRQLLVPAALALALEASRSGGLRPLVAIAAVGLALAVVHPTYAIFLCVPFAGYVAVRWLWRRSAAWPDAAALGALAAPAVLFFLWLLPVVRETSSVSPSPDELQRTLDHYAGQLRIHSASSYSLAPEVFTRAGAVSVAALLLVPFAALAARRRWAAYVVGGALAVFAATLVPFVFGTLSDAVSLSQSRRLGGFFPFAFAFAGGLGVLSRLVGRWLLPAALAGGIALQLLAPGDFTYVLDEGGPAAATWIALAGALAALAYGFLRRPPVEATAALAAALFLLPVVVAGLADWSASGSRPGTHLTPGLVQALREVPERSMVFSDPDTSYRIASVAPVYVAVSLPGHVADTEANRPYERFADARRFARTGDLSIPRRYGANFVVVDGERFPLLGLDLPVVYSDERFTLYRTS